MGMGFCGNFADTVKAKFVEKTVGAKLYADFTEFVDKYGEFGVYSCITNEDNLHLDKVNISDEEAEADANILKKVYASLCEVFHKKTGLSIEYSYHNSSDAGDRYDDIDGAAWLVSGVYELTKAGKKYQKHINRAFFVQYG